MSDKQDTRRENRFHLARGRERIDNSAIPAAVAKTPNLILRHIGSPTDYTLAWVSHQTLAEKLKTSERTIERHCEAIRESDILTITLEGLSKARQRLAKF